MVTSAIVMCDVPQTYLVGGHCERVNVTFLRGHGMREAKLRWVQHFRGHVTDNSQLGCCRATWIHNGGVGYEPCDLEVPQARRVFLSDQNVSLYRTRISASPNPNLCSSLTGLMPLCTILSEWRYSRPQAACASFRAWSLRRFVCKELR